MLLIKASSLVSYFVFYLVHQVKVLYKEGQLNYFGLLSVSPVMTSPGYIQGTSDEIKTQWTEEAFANIKLVLSDLWVDVIYAVDKFFGIKITENRKFVRKIENTRYLGKRKSWEIYGKSLEMEIVIGKLKDENSRALFAWNLCFFMQIWRYECFLRRLPRCLN